MPPPDRPKFTQKQGEYLAFIHAYTQLHRRPPAEADIQEYFRVSAPAVHSMIVTLEKRGLISREAGRARTIRVLVPLLQLPTSAATGSPSLEEGAAERARLVEDMAGRIIDKLFEQYEQAGMDDADFAPFIPRVLSTVREALGGSAISSTEADQVVDRLREKAVDAYVALCAEHSPQGADAREDAKVFRSLMARQRAKV